MNSQRIYPAKVLRPNYSRALLRPRLFDFLDSARTRPLTWIAAPPGAGKTALVSSYLDHHDVTCLWYQIDDSDVDPASFFHYLSLATKVATPRLRKSLPNLTPDHLASLTAFARNFFEALFQRLPSQALLVFDNYQEVTSNAVLHGILARVLEQLPPGINAMIISRTEPPPAYARLRAQGAVSFLGYESLKFTKEEAIQCAQAYSNNAFSKERLAQLHAQVDGWVAGLVLLTEHARTHGTDLPTTEAFASDVLFDYFAGEILDEMAPDDQRMLVASALLVNITPQAIETLTGNRRAAKLLTELARKNYFTTYRSKPQATYQYHPLFRAFLLAKTRVYFTQEQLIDLLNIAAEILINEGKQEEAWVLLCESQNWTLLRKLLLGQAELLFAQGRMQTLYDWLMRFPAENLRTDPWLLYWLGSCLLFTQPRESNKAFETAFSLFEKNDDVYGLYLSWCGAVESLLLVFTNLPELDHWLSVFDDLRQKHPSLPSREIEARVTLCAASAMIQQRPEHPSLPEWLAYAVERINYLPNTNTKIKSAAGLAVRSVFVGNYVLALRLCAVVSSHLADRDVAPISKMLMTNLLAMLGWLQASRRECSSAVSEVLADYELLSVPILGPNIFINCVYGALVDGDLVVAAELVEHIEEAHRHDIPMDQINKLQAYSLIAYTEGDLLNSLSYAEQALSQGLGCGNIFVEALCHIIVAQIKFELNEETKTWEHLKAATVLAERMSSRSLLDICRFLEARIYLKHHDYEKGLKALRDSLELNKQMGGPSYPYFSRETMIELYRIALAEGIEVEHVRHMIEHRKLVPASPPLELENWPWPYRVYTLGRFSIVRGKEPLRFKGKVQIKPLDLLKAIIALGGRNVSAKRVADLLWPDADGDAGQNSLVVTLHRLRKLIGNDSAIGLSEGILTLNANQIWVDVWMLERLLNHVDDLVKKHENIKDISQKIESIFKLYQGPFMNGMDDKWFIALREKLQGRVLNCIDGLVQLLVQQGGEEYAKRYLQRITEIRNMLLQ